MGTRADFYVGRGPDAEWLGSIAWDGGPDGIREAILTAVDEETYRGEVADLLAQRVDGTTPDMGWPWPWEDSQTTDYAYAFDDGTVWASSFGYGWFVATEGEPEDADDVPVPGEGKTAVFPDMSDRMAVTYGSRSGLMVVERSGLVPAEVIDEREASA